LSSSNEKDGVDDEQILAELIGEKRCKSCSNLYNVASSLYELRHDTTSLQFDPFTYCSDICSFFNDDE
jgi:hypothetical protein